MIKLHAVLALLFAAQMEAAPLPAAAPITTAADLRTAASEAPVAQIDFTVPENESAAEEALARRFFNRPEEHRYSGMTNSNWSAKWQLFSDSLVSRAKKQGLDSRNLDACLRSLNQGRNRQTMLAPAIPGDSIFPPDTPDATIRAHEKAMEAKYQLALREREKHPERFYNDSLAIVPVAAYLGRHARGECWIIVCKWEISATNGVSQLGHIMVWAMDTKTMAVVGYVTCD